MLEYLDHVSHDAPLRQRDSLIDLGYRHILLVEEVGLSVGHFFDAIALANWSKCDEVLQDGVSNCEQIIWGEEGCDSFLDGLIDAS